VESMESIQQRLIEDFSSLGDGLGQYSYLIEQSARLPHMSDELKTRSVLVDGCQSHVWMHITRDELGRIHVAADSDAFIVRGVLYTIGLIYENRTASEVDAFSFELIDRTALWDVFSDSRRIGVKHITDLIQKTAREE
jgi:cysteine desulfuration protein SufE